jgi:BON domain
MRGNASRLAAILFAVTLLSACNLINSLQTPDDKAIVADVQAKLFQDPVLKMRDIQVASQKGVVVLTGSVNTDLEKAAAARIASEAKGVKQVFNQLDVSGSSPAASAPPEATTSAANNPPPAPEPVRESPRRASPSRSEHTRSASHARRPAAPAAAPAPAPDEASAPAPPPAPVARAASAPAPVAPPEPPPPQQVNIPSGTVVSIRMIDGIDSSRNQPGDEFAASVAAPVSVDGQVIIPMGADARVRLVQAASAGKMTGRSELQIQLIQVSVNGRPYNVESSSYQQTGASRGTRTAETVGGGAALGAIIGAIAGRGKGAAIGAGIGAAAGTGVQAATKGEQVKIPPETKIDFTLKAAVTVTL